jgi:hypothetical protein
MLAVNPIADRARLHCAAHDIVDIHFADQQIVYKQPKRVRRTVLALSVSGHAATFERIAVSRWVGKKI